jgi:PBP1b-binding outer membrane lipoprotein LpoB
MTFVALLLAGAAFAEEPAPTTETTTTTTETTAPAEPTTTAETTPAAERVDCATLEADAQKLCMNTQALEKAKAELAKVPDCATKTGEELTRCESTRADLERRIASLDPATAGETTEKPMKRRGKGKRSNSNRMEAESSDE